MVKGNSDELWPEPSINSNNVLVLTIQVYCFISFKDQHVTAYLFQQIVFLFCVMKKDLENRNLKQDQLDLENIIAMP